MIEAEYDILKYNNYQWTHVSALSVNAMKTGSIKTNFGYHRQKVLFLSNLMSSLVWDNVCKSDIAISYCYLTVRFYEVILVNHFKIEQIQTKLFANVKHNPNMCQNKLS